MAKATTASKQVEQQALLGGASSTELATVDPAATSALVTHDELDGLDDYGDDGLSQVDGDDLKLSLKIWNMKGIDPVTKRQIPADVFFDTVTETTSEHLDVVLLDLRKSREWREFLEAEKKSVIHCRSADRITGTMEDGTQRYCEGCPEAQWATTDEGKRKQRCGPVYSVAAVEVETQQLCVLRFKSTSLSVIKAHLNRHHLGRRVVAGQRKNYPLFAFKVRLSLKMDSGGLYALPSIERTGICSPDLIRSAAESAKFYRDTLSKHLDKLAERDVEPAADAGGGDTSFDPSQFVDAPGETVGGAAAGFSHE